MDARKVCRAFFALTLVALMGCTAGRPAQGPGSQPGQAPAAARRTKAITMAVISEIRTLGGPPGVSAGAAPTRMIHPFLNEYLTARDQDDVNWPRLATRR